MATPKMPKTVEAVLLHQLDMLDAEAYKIIAATADKQGKSWSWSDSFGRWVYTPGAETVDESDDEDPDRLWDGEPPF